MNIPDYTDCKLLKTSQLFSNMQVSRSCKVGSGKIYKSKLKKLGLYTYNTSNYHNYTIHFVTQFTKT